MAHLGFSYTLEIAFSQPVRSHSFTLRCLPRESACQHIARLEAEVCPEGSLSYGADGFGNRYLYGARLAPHSRFAVRVAGEAITSGAREPLPQGPGLGLFRAATPLTRPGPALSALYAALPPWDGADPSARAQARMGQVSAALRYAPGVTAASTTGEQAAQGGAGVCQDYAHILLALLRMDGIPCRYVCGMMAGEGASHAWVEAAAGGCWLGLDPTNSREAGGDYLAFSVGRDAADCAINRGIYRGWAVQTAAVSAVVRRQEG